jgi:hypothetical protein
MRHDTGVALREQRPATPTDLARLGLAVAAAIACLIGFAGCFGGGSGSSDATPREDEATGNAPPSTSRAPPSPADPGPGRIVGYVRDVNGNPVAGARVRVSGMGRTTRASTQGRYVLPVPRAARTLVAEHPAHVPETVALTREVVRGRRVDFSLAATRVIRGAPNSADALIFWANCSKLAELSAAQLEHLVADGVDGFVCMTGRLYTMGGEDRFTADDPARVADAAYEFQRNLRRSPLVKLARTRRLMLYLGFKAANYTNFNTPFQDWFDDSGWSRDVLRPAREIAAAARSLGFLGVALDQELYPAKDRNLSASWNWNYPGSNRSEQDVRRQVERRGRELMRALLAGYPGLELVAYNTKLPASWSEKVQEVINDEPGAFADDVRLDLWAGLAGVTGYTAIRWLDSINYKAPHIGRDWSVALRYNANSTYSLLSRRVPNWGYASSRLHLSPFSWIDEGPADSDFDDARDPSYVADQLAAFRSWGTGGMFANYTYRGPVGFDYEPYVRALRSASTPGIVDDEPPQLSVTSPAGGKAIAVSQDRLEIAGTAHDNLAIRVVRWHDAKGRSGTARLDWRAEDSLNPDGTWVTEWRTDAIPLSPGMNRIAVVAEDIKGLATVRTLSIRR